MGKLGAVRRLFILFLKILFIPVSGKKCYTVDTLSEVDWWSGDISYLSLP